MVDEAHMLEWTPEWTTKLAEFDNDHKHLVDLHNDLLAACLYGRGPGVAMPILEELIRYTEDHFSREEALFGKFHYPRTEEHVADHDKLRKKLLEIHEELKSGATKTLARDTLLFLNEWIETHTLNQDRLYGDFLNEQISMHGG